MESALVQKQHTGIALTATMQQSLRILRMTNAELSDMLATVAERNPFMRLVRKGNGRQPANAGLAPGQEAIAAGPSLFEHVKSQIRQNIRDPLDRSIARHLALALAPTGWLEGDLAVLAAEIRCPLPRAEKVLARLQTFEPAGLFARNLTECLRIQAREAGFLDDGFERVLHNLPAFAQGGKDELARLCGLSGVEVLILLRKMRSLDPKPGLRFWFGQENTPPPDILLRGKPGDWQVEANEAAFPSIRLQIGHVEALAKSDSEALKSALGEAHFLNAALSRRKATLLHIAVCVVQRQSEFLEGRETMPRPLTLADIAEECQLHISTISRSISGSVIETPRGRLSLKTLFSRRVAGAGTAHVSRASLGEVIRQMVEAEDARNPLRDMAIVSALCRKGYDVKRRTVVNYRRDLGIPSAAERRKKAPALPASPRKRGEPGGRLTGSPARAVRNGSQPASRPMRSGMPT